MVLDREDIVPSRGASNLGATTPWSCLGSAVERSAAAILEGREPLVPVLEALIAAAEAERAFVVRTDATTGEPRVLAVVSRRPDGDATPSRTVLRRALVARRASRFGEPFDHASADGASVRRLEIRTVAVAPVAGLGRAAALVIDSRSASPFSGRFPPALLDAFAAVISLVAGRSRGDVARAVDVDPGPDDLVGRSSAFREAVRAARAAAATALPVLVLGESGTGKEILARAVHHWSPRRRGPFVPLNGAAVPEGLLESELFGSVRGAFTGADRDRAGLFRLAHGGTLFLDEIGDMPIGLQSKLLRALQDGRVRPVGGPECDVDVRVVAATHHDLDRRVATGRFRADLLYRLAVLPVRIPPLRERPGDLEELAAHLLHRLRKRHALPEASLSAGAVTRLREHAWPGNVRELESVLARAVLRTGGGVLGPDDVDSLATLPRASGPSSAREESGPSLERSMIEAALAASRGSVAHAAGRIGWSRQKLYRRMARLRIKPR